MDGFALLMMVMITQVFFCTGLDDAFVRHVKADVEAVSVNHVGGFVRRVKQNSAVATDAVSLSARVQQWRRAAPLIEKLAASGVNITIIEVGACDGDFRNSNDPVQSVLDKPNVRAYLLEPNPLVFATLEKNVNEHFNGSERISPMNLAISAETSGEMSFFVVSKKFGTDYPSMPHWAKYQLSSLNRSHVTSASGLLRMTAEDFGNKYVEEIKVTSKTPRDFLRAIHKGPADVTVLMVDAEGFDNVIVNGFLDVSEFRPKMIIWEHSHLTAENKTQVIERIKGLGYHVKVDNMNALASQM